ncbi:MAG TPA: hypothetical protein VFW49_14775 [Fluviicoccus sp.]|nr:hypothetical protein [Fluviicoccus sp.]
MTEFKSQAMRDIAARRQAGQSQAEKAVKAALTDLARIKETVEILDGTRGDNRAVTQSDLAELAKVGMQSPTSGATIAELRADVQRLYDAIHKIANLYPSQKRGYRRLFGKNRD